MEPYMNDHNFPSLFSITDSNIPSFEEAFDTNSLRKFFRQKDSSMYSLKEFSVEEETRSQTLESFSPMTPSQSHGFIDCFQSGGKDCWQDMFRGSNQGVDKSASDHQSGKSYDRQGDEDAAKQQKRKEENDYQDMIAKLCIEMQEFYEDSTSRKNFEAPGLGQAQQRQQSSVYQKKSNKKEQELHNGVIRRLIQKKSIFKVHRKKDLQVPQTASPVMKPATFNPVHEVKPQKKIAVEFMTQPQLTSKPEVGLQGIVNQEKRERISFQLGSNMSFGMGNRGYNRGTMMVSNMNNKGVPSSLINYLS